MRHFIGTQTHLSPIPPKISFSSDFGHFILKRLENENVYYVLSKQLGTEVDVLCSGGRPSLLARLGNPSRPSPAFDAYEQQKS